MALGPEYERSMAASIPLKQLGTVEDIGYAALLLASKEAAYITGQTIYADEGRPGLPPGRYVRLLRIG